MLPPICWSTSTFGARALSGETGLGVQEHRVLQLCWAQLSLLPVEKPAGYPSTLGVHRLGMENKQGQAGSTFAGNASHPLCIVKKKNVIPVMKEISGGPGVYLQYNGQSSKSCKKLNVHIL